MCGILGAPVGVAGLDRALAALAWRGPDGRGRVTLAGYELAVRRLAITDPGAPQPVVLGEPGRRMALVFNGNLAYPDRWRRRLAAAGLRPRGGNDAELVALAWRAFGDEVFARLDGPFALALVDEAGQRLLLARDRFGEKPLFFGRLAGRAWPCFASTPAALGRLLGTPPSLSRAAEPGFLARGWLGPGGLGLDEGTGIHGLEAGFLRVFDRDGREQGTALGFGQEQRLEGTELPLDTLLLRAVEGRLHGERPVGVLLSGGIDSSCLALFAVRAGARPTCYGVDREGWPQESGRAAAVAERLGLPFRAWTVGPEVLDALPALIEAYGLPLGDPSMLVLYALCRRAREDGAGVLLSGEGGDELFHGYRRMRTAPWLGMAHELLPSPLLGSLSRLSARLSRRRWGPILRFLHALDPGREGGYAALWTTAAPADLRALGSVVGTASSRDRSRTREPYECVGNGTAPGAGRVVDPRALELAGYLEGDLMPKLDVASLAAGVEARAPFLDLRLSLAAARLEHPGEFHGKRSLRALLAAALPATLREGPKRGLGVPLDRWLPRWPRCREILAELDEPARGSALRWLAELAQGRGRRRAALLFHVCALALHRRARLGQAIA